MPRQTAKKRKCEETPPKPNVIESCLFCGMNLQDEDSKLKSDERLKLFEATCMFLNISSEDSQWDFEKESFPFCNSCTVFVQEFGALYDELEVVHCKIARLVDSVKEVVKAGSRQSHSGKIKRSKRGSSDTSAKLESVRQQIIASLRIGEDGDEASKDADVNISLKESFSSTSPRKAAKDGESSKKSLDESCDGIPSPPASAKETDHESVEGNGVTDESEEEDEFETYVKEQLEKLKAKGGENSENEEVIPVDESLEEAQIKVEDAADVAPNEDPFAGEVPPTSDNTVASGKKNSQPSVKLRNGGLEEQSSTTAGFGTVIGERYKKFILTPKPDVYVTSVTPQGFKFGRVAVNVKGRAYHCSLCPTFVVYDDKDLILDHIEMVHFGTDHWYPCEYCELSFRLVGQLHIHRRSSHPGSKDRKWTFMCSVCSKRFFDKDMAEEHSNSDHTAMLDNIEKSLRSDERSNKESANADDSIIDPPPNIVEEPPSEKNLVLEPLPFQLRPRSTRQKSLLKSVSDVEDVEIDEEDEDSSAKSSKNVRPSPLAKRKTAAKMVEAAQTVLLDVAKSVAETSVTESDIPLGKLVLCGGCGCRYFSESASAVTTIKKHGVHHKTQKAFPCRLCTNCFTSLQEMVDHVRNHSLEPKFKDYVFYSPL